MGKDLIQKADVLGRTPIFYAAYAGNATAIEAMTSPEYFSKSGDETTSDDEGSHSQILIILTLTLTMPNSNPKLLPTCALTLSVT